MNLGVMIVALAFFGMGLVALIRPRQIGHYFQVQFDSVDGRNEVRAVYGGFGLAMAGALIASEYEPGLREGVRLTLALALAGMAGGRLLGALVEKPGRWPLVFGLLEVAGAVALWLNRH